MTQLPIVSSEPTQQSGGCGCGGCGCGAGAQAEAVVVAPVEETAATSHCC